MGEGTQLRKASDAELLRAVRNAFQELGVETVHVRVIWSVKDVQQTKITLQPKATEETDSAWAMLMGTEGIHTSTIQWSGIEGFPNILVTLTRGELFDDISFTVPKSGSQIQPLTEDNLRLMSAIEDSVAHWRAGVDLSALVGDDLARFYTMRDEQLARLEELNARIIRENHEYRQKLEDELLERRSKLEAELQDRREEEEARLTAFSEELEERKKALDDRSATHARRDQYRGLMAKIQERSQSFALSKDTEGKRHLTHGLFWIALVALGTLVVVLRPGGAAFSSIDPVWAHIRFGTSIASFLAAVVYYIRWTDAWFQRNATEEFRLKRYDLDLDRAGWLVELAIEATEAKDSSGMVGLMERLSRGLFGVDEEAANRATHPADDIRKLLLEAAGGIEVELPGVGRVTLGHKEVRKIQQELQKRDVEERVTG